MTRHDDTDRNASFTGYARKRATTWSVRFFDRFWRWVITIGGIGTVVAVATICVFLVWVVVPLLRDAHLDSPRAMPRTAGDISRAIALGLDDYSAVVWGLHEDGAFRAALISTGEVFSVVRPFGDRKPTARAFSVSGHRAAFGFDDGTIQLATIRFEASELDAATAPAEIRALPPGSQRVLDGGVVTVLPDGSLRRQLFVVAVQPPVAGANGSPVVLVDASVSDARTVVVALHADGGLAAGEVTRKENMMTGETTSTVAEFVLPTPGRSESPAIALRLSEQGDAVFLALRDGTVTRFDTFDLARARRVEVVDVVPDPLARLTAFEFMLGTSTLLVGDSTGRASAWFRTKPADAGTIDGALLTQAHVFPSASAAVTCFASSQRSRMATAGYADGLVRVLHVTTADVIAESRLPTGSIDAITMAAKNDAVGAWSEGQFSRFSLDLAHAEASFRSIFTPVWYETYERPCHVWQSSSGTDDFEPKLGLIPLIFGTIKATFYSMLFSVPIALLAAIFTSEFMHPKTRARVKPMIEMMASLPSVVLGFLAALVIAPFVERSIATVLTVLVAVPTSLLFGATLWQLLPRPVAIRLDGAPRRAAMALTLPLGVLVACAASPWIERLLFAGDIRSWLNTRTGSGVGGWVFLLLPVAAVLVGLAMTRIVTPWLTRRLSGVSRTRAGVAFLAKFLLAAVATVAVAWLLGLILCASRIDPRDCFLGTYVQRNALIVGFVMGFAVIPIIYTLAEDALASVPAHLRSASLGCGATAWQTATRVVLPTALSGVFSAIMVGLGRAVGETMVVVMAAGNTAVLDFSMFNGFRTLSANIAVELPEAVRESTHYRLLFLAALALFVITFVFNTIAEVVRLRFRKRAYQL